MNRDARRRRALAQLAEAVELADAAHAAFSVVDSDDARAWLARAWWLSRRTRGLRILGRPAIRHAQRIVNQAWRASLSPGPAPTPPAGALSVQLPNGDVLTMGEYVEDRLYSTIDLSRRAKKRRWQTRIPEWARSYPPDLPNPHLRAILP